jgi:ADP-ribose pyrophosphatase YjhB (NUDIX family)
MHYDEPVHAAAARELQEKTGLQDIPLTHRGMVYIHASKAGVTIGRVLYHVFHGNAAGELPMITPPDRGECFWGDHTRLQADECMPGFLRIKQLVAESQGLFFDEISADLADHKL